MNLRANQVRQAQAAENPAASTDPTLARREEISRQLKALLDELKRVFGEVVERPFEYREMRLTRWKTRATRFINSNISLQDAIAFAGIHTALGGALDTEHLKSSFSGHESFLEGMIAEIDADATFALKPEARPSESQLLVVKSFTYTK